MRIAVEHRTCYHYPSPQRFSVQSLKLTPSRFEGQRPLSWSISATAEEAKLSTPFRNANGDLVHTLSQICAHEDMEIIARGIVETRDAAGVLRGFREASPPMLFLRDTPRTEADDAIRALSAETLGAAGDRLDGAHRLMNAVRDAVDYVTGSTESETTAAEALAAGKGVCQDHAQVMVAAARVAGVPARYVSGYLFHQSDNAETHAWAELWIDGYGWIGFDPANRMCPTEQYVRLASGLDAVDAAPIRGLRVGDGVEVLNVSLKISETDARA